jgi:RimJ/RimL family protein N-acetyltransferase
LVDGRAAMRIMLEMLDDASANDDTAVRLRLADVHDENWLLDLQGQPHARRYSRNPVTPSAAEHHDWFINTLKDVGRLLFIVEANGTLAGMVRLDRKTERSKVACYEISIALESSHCGRGIGAAALALVRRLVPAAIIEAEILPGNAASKRTFARAGYCSVGGTVYRSLPS